MSKDDVKLPSDADGAVAMNDSATPRRRAANCQGRHQQKSMQEGYAEEHQPNRPKRERARRWGKEMIKVLCQSNVYYLTTTFASYSCTTTAYGNTCEYNKFCSYRIDRLQHVHVFLYCYLLRPSWSSLTMRREPTGVTRLGRTQSTKIHVHVAASYVSVHSSSVPATRRVRRRKITSRAANCLWTISAWRETCLCCEMWSICQEECWVQQWRDQFVIFDQAVCIHRYAVIERVIYAISISQ